MTEIDLRAIFGKNLKKRRIFISKPCRSLKHWGLWNI